MSETPEKNIPDFLELNNKIYLLIIKIKKEKIGIETERNILLKQIQLKLNNAESLGHMMFILDLINEYLEKSKNN
jgi:hypothetical protein